MTTLPRPNTFSSATAAMRWMLHLATRLLARILDMPEPLVRSTGVFVFARVAAVESSVGKTLCPDPPAASVPDLVPPAGALTPSPSTPRQGELP